MSIESKRYDVRFVANYIRKSRAESMDDLEKHRLILTDLCKKNNFRYVEYMEVGTSDSINLRPQISKLLQEVEDGVYDAVCVVDYDRLSRGDMGDQDRITKVFKKSETLIITPDKIYDLNDDIDDEMVEFKGFMARREYKMITKRLRQGKKIGARQGQWTNGTPPYPYLYQHYRDKYNEKGIVVHDERLKVYREMITMALDGIIPNKIAIHLNNKGIFTAKGNKWSGLAVQRILEDETHLGKIVSNKSQGDGHKNKRPNAKEAKRLPREQWVVVENCHEAVKTPEEHNKIIEMIKARTLIPNRGKKQTHVFTGLIKCAICGNAQTFYIRNDGVVCMKPCWYVDNHGKKCTNSGIKMNIVEEMVLEEIRKYKEYILSEAVLETSVKENKFQNQIDEKEDYLYKLKQALQKVNDAYEMGDYSREEWIERKKKRETEIYRVNNELYELKKKSKENEEITNAERLEKLENFFDNLLTYTDNAERNSLYKTIIDSIIWLRIGNTIDMKINFI